MDGRSVGSIEWHQTVEVPVEPGQHTLRLSAGRYTSRGHAFQVKNDEIANFRCHGAMLWPRYVASIVKPSLAISVRAEIPTE